MLPSLLSEPTTPNACRLSKSAPTSFPKTKMLRKNVTEITLPPSGMHVSYFQPLCMPTNTTTLHSGSREPELNITRSISRSALYCQDRIETRKYVSCHIVHISNRHTHLSKAPMRSRLNTSHLLCHVNGVVDGIKT